MKYYLKICRSGGFNNTVYVPEATGLLALFELMPLINWLNVFYKIMLHADIEPVHILSNIELFQKALEGLHVKD